MTDAQLLNHARLVLWDLNDFLAESAPDLLPRRLRSRLGYLLAHLNEKEHASS